MKNRKLITLIAISSTLFTGTAIAASPSGWYGGADLGYNKTEDVSWAFNTGSHPVPFDDGWAGTLKVGKDMGVWRAELEYDHRSNDAKLFGPPGSIDNAKGDISSDSLMFNAYYDFTPTGKITPYLGAGIGVSHVQANDIRKDINGCCTGIVDGSDDVAAMQVMAGAAYQATPNLDVTLEYRYFFTEKPSFDYATACSSTDSIGSCGVAGSTSGDYRNHSILVGLRYWF